VVAVAFLAAAPAPAGAATAPAATQADSAAKLTVLGLETSAPVRLTELPPAHGARRLVGRLSFLVRNDTDTKGRIRVQLFNDVTGHAVVLGPREQRLGAHFRVRLDTPSRGDKSLSPGEEIAVSIVFAAPDGSSFSSATRTARSSRGPPSSPSSASTPSGTAR
jgi:hypothetical protein